MRRRLVRATVRQPDRSDRSSYLRRMRALNAINVYICQIRQEWRKCALFLATLRQRRDGP